MQITLKTDVTIRCFNPARENLTPVLSIKWAPGDIVYATDGFAGDNAKVISGPYLMATCDEEMYVVRFLGPNDTDEDSTYAVFSSDISTKVN